MLGDTDISVETAFGNFVVRVNRIANGPRSIIGDERTLGLLSELRFGLSTSEPKLVLAAERLQHALLESGPFTPRALNAALDSQRFLDQLLRFLDDQFEAGRLQVFEEPAIANVPEQERTVRKPKAEGKPPETPVQRQQPTPETSFEVRFVDEVGQAISGLDVRMIAGERNEKTTTNAAGVALLEGTTVGSGTVSVEDVEALDNILQPRRERLRTGTAPKGLNTTTRQFSGGEFDSTGIKAGTPNTIVVTPVLGKLHLLLRDKSGRSVHANRSYSIQGPQTFEGTTDEQGTLLHENVLPGDYSLSLTVDDDEKLESPVVVKAASDAAPQVRLLGAVPRVAVARLKGLFFETNKSFLLPATFSVFDRFRNVYLQK